MRNSIMKSHGWITLTIILGLLAGLILSREPWKQYKSEKAQSHKAQAETKEILEERADLMSRKANLDSPQGMEEEARKQGYRKSYEKPIDLTELPADR